MHIPKERRDVLIAGVLALIVGLLLGYGVGRQSGGAGDTGTSIGHASTTNPVSTGTDLTGVRKTSVQGSIAEGDSLEVVGQPAGMTVAVKFVSLTKEGWVAIRGANGTTLGAALFASGTHSDVSVPLLKPTTVGENYQALIYFDDGTKTFSLKTETIVLNPDGSVAGATFDAQ